MRDQSQTGESLEAPIRAGGASIHVIAVCGQEIELWKEKFSAAYYSSHQSIICAITHSMRDIIVTKATEKHNMRHNNTLNKGIINIEGNLKSLIISLWQAAI